ncbi:5'-flap endonuclease [Lithohypha guttulata]|uniref:Structure-specific endonuclease subunit SLX4 n=1 Tax=Lithohypha guttulata TaxID=1690604 RepID=A0ABR0K910_9EURO|nr:5'-flap endonuclease [Lithohypha guttulata]
MSAAIVISSSPAGTFARSPTPIEISSPSPSPAKASGNQKLGEYKTLQTTRDSFSTSFVPAKQILGTRSSAENVPVGSPSPPKFKPPPSASPVKVRRPALPLGAVDPQPQKILPSDVRKKKKAVSVGPLQLKKATARKKDWTPTKPTAAGSAETGSGFGINLAQTFAHSQGNEGVERAANSGDGALTKRRKIDLTSVGHEAAMSKLNPVARTTKPRSKSPVKKGLTITARATSHYFGQDQKDEGTLMTQWMASTQARRDAEGDPDTFEVKVKKKIAFKLKKPKTRLRSPETVLKTLDSQEVVFATLSQCARDESPTLIRDTTEAVKQSVQDLPSSPVRTQQTAIYSVESMTPQKIGTARFQSRKSLWTAADRDENDALLHMDDPFDPPAVRDAFAGKDALFEHAVGIPNVDGSRNSLGLLATLKPEETAALSSEETTTFDIDDVTTPPQTTKPAAPVHTRSYSTSSRSPSSKGTKGLGKAPDGEHGLQAISADSAEPAKNKVPAKPNYASWTDEQLKEKVKTYGFKRIRARKTMIDKLDEVWAEQNGLDPVKVKAATKAASQTKKVLQGGDILGTVHALAARPIPKVKKPRAKRSKKDGEHDASERKKGKGSSEQQADSTAIQDDIVDISELDTSNAFDRLAQMTTFADDVLDSFEPSTAPVKGTGVKANTKKKQRPLTPPPTIPPKPTQGSSPGFASPRRQRSASPTTLADTSSSFSRTQEVPLKSLIRQATAHHPPDYATRNHQTHPTWHEKILMYDPIVLEDFTVWLNTEGFNAIGEDAEIDIMEVKHWCQENGICCLWKGGWRGNKKAAKAEE